MPVSPDPFQPVVKGKHYLLPVLGINFKLLCENLSSLLSSLLGKYLYSTANSKESFHPNLLFKETQCYTTETSISMIWINSSAGSPHIFFFLRIFKCLWRGKRSTVNSWEGMTVDRLSSSKASSERDITSTPKAVNNAVRLIIRISKAANERCDLYRNLNSMEMSQCCNCVSHFLLFMKINWETNLRVMQIVILKTMHSKWHNSGVIWGIRGAWNGSKFVPWAKSSLHSNESCCLEFCRSDCVDLDFELCVGDTCISCVEKKAADIFLFLLSPTCFILPSISPSSSFLTFPHLLPSSHGDTRCVSTNFKDHHYSLYPPIHFQW